MMHQQKLLELMRAVPPEHGPTPSTAWANAFAARIIEESANIVNSLAQHEGAGDSSTAEYLKDHFGV